MIGGANGLPSQHRLAFRASLTYIDAVKTHPITIAETQAFARSAEKIWSDDERAELIDFVAHNPEAGDLIPGTGGVRKLRWARSGSGKRGGARVVYFYYRPDCPLYLLLAYAKAQASDLTADEKKAVAAFAAAIKATVD
ncbi:addiction module toxin RelE [Rhizorhabdus wittichii DC-6]|nr:addiction module toxin RelE [Rhizorhabdus wittichii DC-6]